VNDPRVPSPEYERIVTAALDAAITDKDMRAEVERDYQSDFVIEKLPSTKICVRRNTAGTLLYNVGIFAFSLGCFLVSLFYRMIQDMPQESRLVLESAVPLFFGVGLALTALSAAISWYLFRRETRYRAAAESRQQSIIVLRDVQRRLLRDDTRREL
jgi:hypothetical protein